MTKKDKEAQLKAKLLKMKLAESDYETRNRLDKSKSPMSKEVPFGKDKRKKSEIRNDVLDKTISEAKGTKIRPKKPTQADRARIITAKAKVNKLKKKYVDPNPQAETPEEIMQSAEAAGREPTYIAQEHHHKIVFRGHNIGGFKGASLNGQSGKYAKYWLLNAKETNGNGWGIAAHTAKENMKKFIGRPLVVTAQSWHGASEYGDEYEHPYLPTNDINAILNHQEKFRVGSIVDVFEDKHGDWYASIEMLPKFANSRLPPFCSPAIYQLDAAEPEGQISKWEALHLAALTENPAYGARIALLKGTCIGTDNECKVQFKSAKQLIAESPCHDGYEMFGTKSKGGRKVPNCIPAKQAQVTCPIQAKKDKVKSKLSKLKKKQKVSKLKQRLSASGMPDDFAKDPDPFPKNKKLDFNDRENGRGDRQLKIFKKGDSGGIFDRTKGPLEKEVPFGKVKGKNKNLSGQPVSQTPVDIQRENKKIDKYLDKGIKIRPPKPTQADRRKIITAKLKARLAGLGEQNMTYQESKKVKIHKKKHPEVRKAQSSVEDILRSKGRSVDGSHAQSTFLSTTGDFIGGDDIHDIQIRNILDPAGAYGETVTDNFIRENNLIRVQNFPINRAGEKRMSFGINSKPTRTQLKSIQDSEIGGHDIGFSVGPLGKEITGRGYKDLTKALRENKYLG